MWQSGFRRPADLVIDYAVEFDARAVTGRRERVEVRVVSGSGAQRCDEPEANPARARGNDTRVVN